MKNSITNGIEKNKLRELCRDENGYKYEWILRNIFGITYLPKLKFQYYRTFLELFNPICILRKEVFYLFLSAEIILLLSQF